MKDSLALLMFIGACTMFAGLCMLGSPANPAWPWIFGTGSVFMVLGAIMSYIDGY